MDRAGVCGGSQCDDGVFQFILSSMGGWKGRRGEERRKREEERKEEKRTEGEKRRREKKREGKSREEEGKTKP